MTLLKTIYRGESLSILFTFPESYTMARAEEIEVTIGGTIFPHTINGQTAIVRVKSEETAKLYGRVDLAISIQDNLLGVDKILVGQIKFDAITTRYESASESQVYGIIVQLSVSETIITVSNILYNYLRVKSAYELAVENGYTGTAQEFHEDLGNFKFWYEQSVANAEQTALDVLAVREDRGYLESQLFHYIADDETSVTIGVGTQVFVSESTEGLPSVILSLQTI